VNPISPFVQQSRVDAETGAIAAVVTDMDCPNGLAFSADEKTLYVAETGKMFDPDAQRRIRRYGVSEDRVSDGADFHTIGSGCSDGFRLDTDGNIWSSAADGVHCISSDGTLLGKILVPETVSNVCFGGRAKHQLFITASTSVYAITLNRVGLQQP